MASSTATLSAVLTLDDKASPGFARTSRNAAQLRSGLISTGQSLATLSSSMASLLVTTGALESKTGQYATAALSVGGAVLSIIGPLTQLNSLLRTNAAVQGFLAALSGPKGWALLGGAFVAAGGTAAFLGSRAVSNSYDSRNASRNANATVVVSNDLRGATVRGEDDINELSRRVSRNIPPKY